MRALWVVLVGCSLLGLVSVAVAAQHPTWGRGPFQAGRFFQTEGADAGLAARTLTDGRVQVSELRFETPDIPGWPYHATANVKNLTDRTLDVSVYVAVLDKKGHILACGAYNSFAGYKPREMGNETISLGYSGYLDPEWTGSGARTYQIRIASRAQ